MPAPSTRRSAARGFAVLVACLACVAIAAPLASAHSIVLPSASRPADFQQYTVTVPTERDVPTVEIDLKIPEGIGFLIVEEAPGWKTQVIRRNDRIDEIRWTGSEIPPDYYASFRFIARNPVAEGEITWRIVQRYKGGEAVRWIGGPDSDEPAARTTITESAVPVDVVDTVSGKAKPVTTATGTGEAGETAEGSGRDGLTLAIAAGAAGGGVLALAFALLAWRGTRRRGAA
jgi:uncharacterized protein YcnI